MTKRTVPLVPLIATAGALAAARRWRVRRHCHHRGSATHDHGDAQRRKRRHGLRQRSLRRGRASRRRSPARCRAGRTIRPGSGSYGLNPGMTIQQAAGAVNSHGGDINALAGYGKLFVSAAAPGTVQTVLTPGNYVALNVTGNGQPGFTPFTRDSGPPSPAALPPAAATQTRHRVRLPRARSCPRWDDRCGLRTTAGSCT